MATLHSVQSWTYRHLTYTGYVHNLSYVTHTMSLYLFINGSISLHMTLTECLSCRTIPEQYFTFYHHNLSNITWVYLSCYAQMLPNCWSWMRTNFIAGQIPGFCTIVQYSCLYWCHFNFKELTYDFIFALRVGEAGSLSDWKNKSKRR